MDFVMGNREKSILEDMDGKKRLFNLHCNGGVFNLGHRNNELIEVLTTALEDLDIGNHHLLSRERAELASMLADLMPKDLNYTIFGVSGGEAVDVSIKVARGFTGRTGIISAKGGYHGHTGLALAAGDEQYRKPFGPQAHGFSQVPFADLSALAESINERTAAVILETIPATMGIIIPELDYIQGVRRLCDENGVLLILDEVQTGLGRTGKLWAFEHYDILPDIVVLGKGLSGGVYPISATVIREPLEQVFHPDPFIHISTFGGAEVGCRVAKKVLEISSSPDFLSHVNTLADDFKKGLTEIQTKHSRFFLELRQCGLMMGLKLKDDISGPILTKTAYDNDLLMVYANNDQSVCQCLPPLNMDLDDVNYVMTQLDKALSSAKLLRPIAKGKKAIESVWKKITIQ
ncbi:MAG: aspartate aminotransferase family protein [Candidatus Marinimicrobia bacterium]|nr:aspartate aminotransferase family protein [Candidatus Neomarinimicrobiota bacterium]